jgi:hypothetical protein
MNEYRIRYTLEDMPKGYIGSCKKWAHNEKEAVRYLLKKNADKDGRCVFKRGSSGRILSVQEVKH